MGWGEERVSEFQKHRMPERRVGHNVALEINSDDGGAIHGHMTTGELEEGVLGEIFLYLTKEGSTLRGFADAFAIAFSGCLQFAPDPRAALKWLLIKLVGQSFPPKGPTNDPNIPLATSIVDLIARELAALYLTDDERQELEARMRRPIATL